MRGLVPCVALREQRGTFIRGIACEPELATLTRSASYDNFLEEITLWRATVSEDSRHISFLYEEESEMFSVGASVTPHPFRKHLPAGGYRLIPHIHAAPEAYQGVKPRLLQLNPPPTPIRIPFSPKST